MCATSMEKLVAVTGLFIVAMIRKAVLAEEE